MYRTCYCQQIPWKEKPTMCSITGTVSGSCPARDLCCMLFPTSISSSPHSSSSHTVRYEKTKNTDWVFKTKYQSTKVASWHPELRIINHETAKLLWDCWKWWNYIYATNNKVTVTWCWSCHNVSLCVCCVCSAGLPEEGESVSSSDQVFHTGHFCSSSYVNQHSKISGRRAFLPHATLNSLIKNSFRKPLASTNK